MNDNVIVFPKGKKNTPPQSVEELLNSVEEIQREHIEYIAENAVGHAVQYMYDEGFEVQNAQSALLIGLLMDNIKAIMLTAKGKKHPMSDVAYNYFKTEE